MSAKPENFEVVLLHQMAADNCDIAKAFINGNQPGLARGHLRTAIQQLDQAEAAALPIAKPQPEAIEA